MLAVCNAQCGKATLCEATQHWRLWVQPGDIICILCGKGSHVSFARAICSTGTKSREPTTSSTTLWWQPGEGRRSDSTSTVSHFLGTSHALQHSDMYGSKTLLYLNDKDLLICLRRLGSIELLADKVGCKHKQCQAFSSKLVQATVVLIFHDRWLAVRCPTFCQTRSTMVASGTWPSTWSPSTGCCPRSASPRLSPVNQGTVVIQRRGIWTQIWNLFRFSSRLNNILKSKLREYARSLRLAIDKGNTDDELRVQIAGMMAEVYRWVIQFQTRLQFWWWVSSWNYQQWAYPDIVRKIQLGLFLAATSNWFLFQGLWGSA